MLVSIQKPTYPEALNVTNSGDEESSRSTLPLSRYPYGVIMGYNCYMSYAQRLKPLEFGEE